MNDKPKNSLPWLWPAHRPCGAKTRSGQPCRKWCMKNGRCRLHGGLSRGAITSAGKIKSRMANFKHGKYVFERQKPRVIVRLLRAYSIHENRQLGAFEIKLITDRINEMSFNDFQKLKLHLQRLILDNKKNIAIKSMGRFEK
jgi:hypothetical protein